MKPRDDAGRRDDAGVGSLAEEPDARGIDDRESHDRERRESSQESTHPIPPCDPGSGATPDRAAILAAVARPEVDSLAFTGAQC